eukprot:176474-Hanusia_phi.AAC.1
MASANSWDQGGRLSREDFKKRQELEELRKSGAIEPEKDEEGNEINPHIPQYMSSAPWYLNSKGPTLKHQRNLKVQSITEGVAARAVQGLGKGKTVSRTRDEFGEKKKSKDDEGDAPRANGYDTTYAGKRDRWNGFDADMYMKVVKRHELLAKERQALREQNVDKSLQEGESSASRAKQKDESDSSSSDDEDEMKDAEKAEMIDQDGKLVGQQLDTGRLGMQTRVSVRNLRIREDTAKYLRNLDVKSAYYDPKTRSMRSNPNPDKNPHELDYAGENFIRYTGDTVKVARQQLYELEAHERGQDVHMLGMPTQAELLHTQFEDKKTSLVEKQKKQLYEHYGGQEYAEKSIPRAVIFGNTEQYVEYAEDGTIIKGQERRVLNSKYEEDKMTNNHTNVWGSFWYNGKWGYACCCQFIRNSYCTGKTGIEAFDKQKGSRMGLTPFFENSSQMVQTMQAQIQNQKHEKQEKAEGSKKLAMGDRMVGRSADSFDKKALKKAMKDEERREKHESEADERKRKYNSMSTTDVTEEEMEAYMLKKNRGDDPLAGLGKNSNNGYDFV